MKYFVGMFFLRIRLWWRSLRLILDFGPDAAEICARDLSMRDQVQAAAREWVCQAYYLFPFRHRRIVSQMIAEGRYTQAQYERAGYRVILKKGGPFICKKDTDVDLTADFFANPWEDKAVFEALSPGLKAKILEYESDYARLIRHGETALYWMDVYHLEFHFAHSGSG